MPKSIESTLRIATAFLLVVSICCAADPSAIDSGKAPLSTNQRTTSDQLLWSRLSTRGLSPNETMAFGSGESIMDSVKPLLSVPTLIGSGKCLSVGEFGAKPSQDRPSTITRLDGNLVPIATCCHCSCLDCERLGGGSQIGFGCLCGGFFPTLVIVCF